MPRLKKKAGRAEPAIALQPSSPVDGHRFPIVAVGASAGGLEAFQHFISALAPDSGMAFVVILHLDPRHESALAEILARTSSSSDSGTASG